MDGLEYTKFDKAAYLGSPLFNSEDIRVLLALRTRTLEGIRNDFRGMYPSIECPCTMWRRGQNPTYFGLLSYKTTSQK